MTMVLRAAKGDSPIFVDHRCAAVPAKIGTVPGVSLKKGTVSFFNGNIAGACHGLPRDTKPGSESPQQVSLKEAPLI
jgi:hypothetical protein